MNKLMATLVVIALACGVNASQLSWGNNEPIVNSLGVEIPTSSTWLIRLYESVDADIEFSLGAPSSDDTWTGMEFNWNDSLGVDGYITTVFNNSDSTYGVVDNDRMYSVMFNHNSLGSATQYAILDNSVASVLYAGGDYTYDPGGTVAGDWQAVPEPATALLLALGGGIAWLVRLKQRA